MTPTDKEALERALDLQLEEPADRVEQVKSMLAEDWEHAATFSAYHQQIKSLALKPWQNPPCYAHLDGQNDAYSYMRRRLLKAGLSVWEPRPAEALRAAKK